MNKEAYLTAESIGDKANEMLEMVQPFRQQRSYQAFDPGQAALLVLDMQSFFLEEGSHAFIPSAPAILPAVLKLVEAFERMRRPVIFTRHLNSPENARLMSTWWKDLIREESPASRIIAGLNGNSRQVIPKSQYDAFHETPLEERLVEAGVSQVAISGVMTHLCCESTARSAFGRGFEVFFTIDGTATYNEQFHRATLLNLSHGFAHAVLIEELLSIMDKER